MEHLLKVTFATFLSTFEYEKKNHFHKQLLLG